MADIDSAAPGTGEVFDLTAVDRQQLASDIRRWAALRNQREYQEDWSAGGMTAAALESWTQLANAVEHNRAAVAAGATTRIEQVLRATYLDPVARPVDLPRGGLARWVKALEKPVTMTKEDNDHLEEALSDADRLEERLENRAVEVLDGSGVPGPAAGTRRQFYALRSECDHLAQKYGFEDVAALYQHADLYGLTMIKPSAPSLRGERVLPGVDGPSIKEHTMAGTDQVPQDSWESSPEAEGAGWGEPDVPAPAAAAAPAQQQGTRYGRPTTTENIPVSGFLASEPKYTAGAGNKKSFIRARLGLHSFSKGPDGESVDHPNYVDLAAFGRLADKMNGALKKGDDVTGVATQEISTVTRSDGNSELRVRYVADRLGPDLMSGKAQVSLDRKREHRVDQQVTPANVAAAQSRSSSIHM